MKIEVVAKSLDVEPRHIGYFGIHGGATQLITGIKNVTGIQAPESMVFGQEREVAACRPLEDPKVIYVIVYSTYFPCAGFVEIKKSFDRAITIYALSNSGSVSDSGRRIVVANLD